MHNVVAIEREYGAGGTIIADKLAKRLGWKLYDRQLTAEIAREAQVDAAAVDRCDERCDPPLYRLAKVFWRGSYERMLPFPEDKIFDTDTMVAISQKIIDRLADGGRCVIVGRGAPYFVRDRNDRFSVFLYAPRELKIQRVMTQGHAEKEAAELVDTIDEERAAFIKRYFHKEWPYRYLYDLMLNTACGDDTTVELILQAMQTTQSHPAVAG